MSEKNYKTEKENKKFSNGRWWEFYLVRYLVGTIFGTGLALFLVTSSGSGVSKLIQEVTSPNKFNITVPTDSIWFFVLIGLGFCYLASSPILVLHAYRASLFYILNPGNKIYKNSKLIILAIILFILSCISLFIIIKYYSGYLYCALALYLITVFQLTLVFVGFRFDCISKYYEELSNNRSEPSSAESEYIESYKHLREHGNAFSIIFMEFVLSIFIYYVDNLYLLVGVIFIWIFPSATVWLLGTKLEYLFANSKLEILLKTKKSSS